MKKDLVTSKDLAEYLGVTEGTVRNWRSLNQGPPYVKMGKLRNSKIRYDMNVVKKWLTKHSGAQQ